VLVKSLLKTDIVDNSSGSNFETTVTNSSSASNGWSYTRSASPVWNKNLK